MRRLTITYDRLDGWFRTDEDTAYGGNVQESRSFVGAVQAMTPFVGETAAHWNTSALMDGKITSITLEAP